MFQIRSYIPLFAAVLGKSHRRGSSSLSKFQSGKNIKVERCKTDYFRKIMGCLSQSYEKASLVSCLQLIRNKLV